MYRKRPSAYLKMRILGAIEYADGKSIKERIQKVSESSFIDENGNKRMFTWRTISTWYYRYKSNGITCVKPKPRADKGCTRKITPEQLLEAINQVLPLFRKGRFNKRDIYRKCLQKGLFTVKQISQTSFYRFIREYELLNDKISSANKIRLAFAMEYANQLWQADTMYGPYVKDENGKLRQTYLIAFIDDASRLITHAQFFFAETTASLITAFKKALYKRGIPEQLYLDNGSIYTSKEITLICARLGCLLRHTPVRDGASKGKIERWFNTLRNQFLILNLDLSSIHQLNKQLNQWVEEVYNSRIHSAISMKPIDRFSLDSKRIRFFEPNQFNDELFYYEDQRSVKDDNTFSFNSNRYEAPTDCRGKKITIRFDRLIKDPVIVYYKGKRAGKARLVDLIANGKLKRYKKGGPK